MKKKLSESVLKFDIFRYLKMFVSEFKHCKTMRSISSFNCVTGLPGEIILNFKVQTWEHWYGT